MKRRTGWIMAAMSVVVLAGAGAEASTRNPPAEHRVQPYFAHLPHCHEPAVLENIAGRFASRENTYWGSGFQIAGFDRVGQRALRPWGRDFVPQRFCTARGHFNDGKLRQVVYRVREALGPFGNTWEVIWCVNGLDRHRTYAPGCEQATHWN
jgi:hypothetical protein